VGLLRLLPKPSQGSSARSQRSPRRQLQRSPNRRCGLRLSFGLLFRMTREALLSLNRTRPPNDKRSIWPTWAPCGSPSSAEATGPKKGCQTKNGLPLRKAQSVPPGLSTLPPRGGICGRFASDTSAGSGHFRRSCFGFLVHGVAVGIAPRQISAANLRCNSGPDSYEELRRGDCVIAALFISPRRRTAAIIRRDGDAAVLARRAHERSQ
jgi:hypothetical protein